MSFLSKPKLNENKTIITFPQGFTWEWSDNNGAVSSYADVIDLWRLGQVRGAVIGVGVTVVMAAVGAGIYKIVKAKKKAKE